MKRKFILIIAGYFLIMLGILGIKELEKKFTPKLVEIDKIIYVDREIPKKVIVKEISERTLYKQTDKNLFTILEYPEEQYDNDEWKLYRIVYEGTEEWCFYGEGKLKFIAIKR